MLPIHHEASSSCPIPSRLLTTAVPTAHDARNVVPAGPEALAEPLETAESRKAAQQQRHPPGRSRTYRRWQEGVD